jgi:hypothetical protein
MKLKTFLAFFLSLIILSCKKDDGTINPTTPTTPSTIPITPSKPIEVTSVQKTDLKTGSILEIVGKNFSTNPADNIITINGVKALDVITISNILTTKLQATIPYQATSGDLVLTASGKRFELGSITIKQFIPKNGWEVAPSFTGISGFTKLFSFENKVFYWGSTNFDSKYSLYEFNGIQWNKKNDLPFDIYGLPAFFSVNGKGYLLPNVTKINGVLSKSVWEYDPSTDKWTELVNFPGASRTGGIVFTMNNKAYYGLGSDDALKYLSDIWEFDGNSKKWTQKKNYPYFLNALFGGGNLYYYGFSNEKVYMEMQSVPNSIFLEYNTQNDVWTKRNKIIDNLILETISYKNTIYAITENYGANLVTNDESFNKLYDYDVNSSKFSYIKDLVCARRGGLNVFIVNDKLYVGMGTGFKDLWSHKL